MNRRESRVSTGARQNDALFEFESFKKKFLLANKHITKLNSTLSVRIEELNAQISTLYVENLRLRASEIALSAQLKKEREKSRKIIAEAENATISLSKHLIFLRHTFDIAPAPSPPPSPPPPKARRPPLGSVASPQMPRLSRPPTIPGISEDNECSSADEQPKRQPANTQTTSPARRKIKAKPRLSASRLPLPSRGSPPLLDIPTSPTVPPPMEVALSNGGAASKHLPRRQSGFLTVDLPPSLQRPPSPAFGSPILLNAALDDDGETTDARAVDDPDYESEEKVTKRDKRKGKAKESALEKESLIDVPRSRERDRKRPREDDFSPSTVVADSKLKLVDVTNSPRPTLSSLDPGVTDRIRYQVADHDVHTSTTGAGSVQAPTTSSSPTQLPTPRASTSPIPIPPPESEPNATTLRERRTRKSVNYAEPKLNTKMRKPDPPPGTTSATRKRPSATNVSHTHTMAQSEDDVDEPAPRSSLEHDVTPKPIKRDSTPDVFAPPLPPIPIKFLQPSVSRPSAATTIKRKKSRPHIVPSDDESDGAQADVDADFTGKGIGGWFNLERRRKSSHASGLSSSRSTVPEQLAGEAGMEFDGRRHSVAV